MSAVVECSRWLMWAATYGFTAVNSTGVQNTSFSSDLRLQESGGYQVSYALHSMKPASWDIWDAIPVHLCGKQFYGLMSNM